jgi:hypothetical protein
LLHREATKKEKRKIGRRVEINDFRVTELETVGNLLSDRDTFTSWTKKIQGTFGVYCAMHLEGKTGCFQKYVRH